MSEELAATCRALLDTAASDARITSIIYNVIDKMYNRILWSPPSQKHVLYATGIYVNDSICHYLEQKSLLKVISTIIF